MSAFDEDPVFNVIRLDDLICRDCEFRHDDWSKVGNCRIYEEKLKPLSVFNGDDCGYYRKDEEVPATVSSG